MQRSIQQRLGRAGSIAAGAAALAGSAQAQSVDLTLYRMKRDSMTTLVLGIVEVQRPLSRERPCPYQVELRVTDQSHVTLLNDKWREERGCPASLPRTLVTYESLRPAVVPGRYEFAASMYPEGKADEARRKSVMVESLPAGARASDLILAREIGVVDSANSARWTIRHDGVGMITAPETRIAAESPKLAFYLEVYPRGAEPITGKVVGTVQDAEGKQIAKMDLAVINGAAQQPRSRVAGSASVGGLPPGTYTLDATIELADTTFTRSAKFTMDAPVSVAQINRGTGYFGTLSADELKQLFDPLAVWLETKEERAIYTTLSETGRREYLARYFGPNPPTGDSKNLLDLYLERARRVNERYAERTGRTTVGWQTDRGRIYMLRGEPNKQVKRPFQADAAPPYEIWQYDIGTQYVYLFADDSRFGHYRLVFTTDPREISLPDWQGRVGPSAIEDLRTQFNIRTQD